MKNFYNSKLRALQAELKTAKNSAKSKIRAEINEIKRMSKEHCDC